MLNLITFFRQYPEALKALSEGSRPFKGIEDNDVRVNRMLNTLMSLAVEPAAWHTRRDALLELAQDALTVLEYNCNTPMPTVEVGGDLTSKDGTLMFTEAPPTDDVPAPPAEL